MFPTAIVLVALAAPPATPAEAFRKAEELYAADKFGEAEPLFRAALASDEPFLKRRAYTRLMNLYVRSGRPDKAVQLAEPYRAWLKEVRDPEGLAALDLLTGECLHELGYAAQADKHLVAALGADPPLPLDRRLEALRLRAEVALHRKDAAEKERWAELEKAAATATERAVQQNDTAVRVQAGRYLAEALFRRGDTDAALAALAGFPELHDKLDDPLGRRDTQRQRAKLLVAKGKYTDAAPLFKEALELHRKHQPKRRLVAGDILAEWSVAALTQSSTAVGRAEAARLRAEAAVEYRSALDSPDDNPDAGGPLAALVRLQALTRSAKQFTEALHVAVTDGERWSNDPLVDGRLKSDRGGLELMTAAYKTARASLAKALADLDAADPPNLRALPKVLINLATAELALDAPEKADSLLARVTDLYRKHNLTPDPVRVECDYLTGASAARRGDYARAMAHFRAGLALSETVGRAADPVRFNLWLNVALIHKDQGDPGPALEALKKASDVLTGFTEPDDISVALIDAVRADLHISQGQVASALALVPNLEAACARYGTRSGYLWATAKHVRALDLLVRKDVPAAGVIWAELADAQRKEKNGLLARTLNCLGVCAELSGRDSDAAKLFEEARAFQVERPRGSAVTRGITLWRLAVLADRAGKKSEAKKLLTEVFDVADRARLNTFGEAAQRAKFFANFAPAFEQLVAWCARDGDGEGLLRAAVRSRSRTLIDQMLAAGIDPRDRLTGPEGAALVAREAQARRAVSLLRARVMFLPAEAESTPEAKKLLAELEAAQKEYAAAWFEITNADPLTRVLTDPAFGEAALTQVRKAAHDAGGVLLTYVVGRDESFAVLCTDPSAAPQVFKLSVARAATDVGDLPPGDATARAGFRGVTIKPTGPQPARPAPGPVEVVALTDLVTARLVSQYLRNVADPSFSPTRGINLVSRTPGVTKPSAPEVLGEAILPAALRDKIRAANAKRVVLIPDGALHKLPFECLLLAAPGGPKYALDELPPVCYAPSIPALAVVLNRQRALGGAASLLTVGDPAYPETGAGAAALPRLPFTSVESKKVRETFPAAGVTALEGTDATEARVAAAIPGKRFVHLAAHGFADEQFGSAFAAIALTPPRGTADPSNDGYLTLHEITRLKLAGCELTVLSACVTNVGPQQQFEAGVTLAGAFLGAGSRGVMASCWSVDDRATAELMGTFFGAIRPATGKAPGHADALKAARAAVRGKPGWEAPFYWAPFVYVGPPE